MLRTKLFWLLSSLCLIKGVFSDSPCVPKVAEYGLVCVCNSTYCDTLERPVPLNKGQYYQYTTSDSSPGISQAIGNFSTDTARGNDDVVFKINCSVKYQEIIGFGGSFTGSAGAAIATLPEDAQDKLLKSYFGPTGIEYTMARVPIGASDFSLRPYTLDDVPNDVNLEYFSLADEDYIYKIPLIQKAKSLSQRRINLIGSTWTAPAWMKLNKDYSCGYLESKYLHIWAQYHIKFLESCNNMGINFWGLTTGNEALLGLVLRKGLLNCTIMMAPTQRYWLKKHLRPLLQASNFSDVKLLSIDDLRLFSIYWIDRLEKDPEAAKSIDGFALHWYFDWITPTSFLDKMHEKFPNKIIAYTETSINVLFGQIAVMLGSWNRAEYYIYNIIQNLNHWSQTYIDWNIALNLQGGPFIGKPIDASIIVNSSSGEFYKQPMYYALGHFSKFIHPGSRRILVESNSKSSPGNYQPSSTTSSKAMIEEFMSQTDINYHPGSHRFIPMVPPGTIAVATANPEGSCTLVVFNSMNVTVRVRIEDPQMGSITKDAAAHSVTTFVYWP